MTLVVPDFMVPPDQEAALTFSHFMALNFFTRKSSQKIWAPGAIVEPKFQEIDPWTQT